MPKTKKCTFQKHSGTSSDSAPETPKAQTIALDSTDEEAAQSVWDEFDQLASTGTLYPNKVEEMAVLAARARRVRLRGLIDAECAREGVACGKGSTPSQGVAS